jgi:hypothetical protein
MTTVSWSASYRPDHSNISHSTDVFKVSCSPASGAWSFHLVDTRSDRSLNNACGDELT